MSLADDVARELPGLRAAAESLMQDTCTVRRQTGKGDINPTTGLRDPIYSTLFTSRCKVSGRSAGADVAPRTVDIAGVEYAVLEGGIHLPIPASGSPAAGLREDDEVVITAVGPLTDPAVTGNVYRVVGFGAKSYATARRIDVVEV